MKYRKEYDRSLLEEVISYDAEKKISIDKPVILEIGCGNGHFLINKAQEKKDQIYFGLDLKSERLIRCREKQVKHGIENIRWIHGDAMNILSDMFGKGSISGIYMIFPDPWPKRKHHKNRLFKKEFTDVVYDKLIPSGFFIFVTDHKEYFDEVLSLIENDARFVINNPINMDDFSVSVFGDKWKKDDRIYHIVRFEKKNER